MYEMDNLMSSRDNRMTRPDNDFRKIGSRFRRRNPSIDNKKSVTLPHKALPDQEGLAYWLDKSKDLAMYSYSKDRDSIFGFSFLVAHELMSTDLAVEEGGYPTQPSVLVINARYNPEDRTRNEDSLIEKLEKELDTSTEKKFSPYGPTDPYAFMGRSGMDFSESRFLEKINVYAATGIHHFHLSSTSSPVVLKRHIEAARKFFDIVIIDPDGDWKYREEYGKKIHLTTDHYSKNEEDDTHIKHYRRLNSYFADKASGKVKLAMISDEEITFGLARNLSQDIARYLIGAELRSESAVEETSALVQKMSGIEDSVTRMKNKIGMPRDFFLDPLIVVIPFLTAPAGLEVMLTDVGSAFPATGILGGLILGASVFLFGGAAVDISTRTVRGFAGRKHEKKLLKAMKQGQMIEGSNYDSSEYPFLPVKETPAASAYDKNKYLTELIERVDVGGRGSADALLPLEVVNLRIEKLQERWAAYELDPVKALEFPMLLDASAPTTATFFASLQELNTYQDEFKSDPTKARLLMTAVSKAEKAFVIAENAAKKAKASYLNSEQKKRIKSAKPLLAMATDESASPTERMGAWKRANDLLAGVLALPDASVMGLLPAAPERQEDTEAA